MNLLFLFCKCENYSENDINLNLNKKTSRNSLRKNKIDNQNDEILSNDSTSNLEIIDYPYTKNYKEEKISTLNSNNVNINNSPSNYYMSNINKVKKITNDLIDNDIFNNKSPKNSINNSSSIIVNNDDNFLQNKAFLSNFYSNCESINKKIGKKDMVPNKKFIKKNRNKNLRKKLRSKMDIGKPYSGLDFIKMNQKSNSQTISAKNINRKNKTIKSCLDGFRKIKKCQTNIAIHDKGDKLKTNKIKKNKKLLNKIHPKRKNFISYNQYKNKDEIKEGKKSLNIIKNVYKVCININYINKSYDISHNKLNNSDKKFISVPRRTRNSSYSGIGNPLTNKNNLNTNSYGCKKKNILNYSYLWLSNRENNCLSKSCANPFDKIKDKNK